MTHEIWERDAHAQRMSTNMAVGNPLTQSGKELLDATQTSYSEALRPYFVKDAPLRLEGFGSPPRHEAAFEKIVSLTKRDDEFVVRTRMTRQNGSASFTDEYDYIVVFEDGEPKIRTLQWIADE